MFYTSGRNKPMKSDICAPYIFEEEEGAESETRTLAYIWKVEGNRFEEKGGFWVPGRGGTRKCRRYTQALPTFQGVCEIRRGRAVSRLFQLHRSLGLKFFSPRSAVEMQYKTYCRLPQEEAAQKVYWHYKE